MLNGIAQHQNKTNRRLRWVCPEAAFALRAFFFSTITTGRFYGLTLGLTHGQKPTR
jgi:hypothetical protein